MTAIVIVAAVVVILGGIAAGITLLVMRAWTKKVLAGEGYELQPVSSEFVDQFLSEGASFVVSAEREFPYPPQKVWDALQLNGTFSWIPLINGIRYRDDYRREGAMRTFDGLLVAAEERVVTMAPGSRLTVTGVKASVPVVLKSFIEDYRLAETENGTRLTWTLAFRPRFGAFVPLRWTAPFIRPFARIGIKGLAARI
ncbi:SRPBCC family protein [Nocardia huaxiensis]|uniref:SRPBCC family protein n=1 Tax=Nocardia huaxiensis TaxID=2755382 RepID=A0A7D6VGR3_9NOCA|nr:SRPBCC family protein [Nocardia huaxiensis]